MRNLIYRIITVILLLPVVLAAFILGGYYLTILLSIASILACLEAATIIQPKSLKAKGLAMVFWAGLFLPAIIGKGMFFLVLLFPALVLFNMIVLFDQSIDDEGFTKLCGIFYWSLYINLAVACIYWLVNKPELLDPRVGLSFIFLACVSTWSNDTFAYFGGRLLGKTPLFKRVSGKKTWEGFIVGAILSIISVFILKYLPLYFGVDCLPGLTTCDLLWVVLPSILLAPCGDLIESRLKRLYDTKDSSQILPGHGGLLDRIDGLLMVLPWTALYAFNIRSIWY